MWEVKYRLHFLNISFRSRDIQVFKICKSAKWWCHTLNQILIKYMKVRYLNQFVSEMIESWQQDLTRCGHLQYEIINYVTMATYWFPDLPYERGFSGFFWSSILIFFSDVLFARSSKHINVFTVDYLSFFNFFWAEIHQNSENNQEDWKECVAVETEFNYIWKCVTFGTMSVSSFNGFCHKLIKVASVIFNVKLGWVHDVISLLICTFYQFLCLVWSTDTMRKC